MRELRIKSWDEIVDDVTQFIFDSAAYNSSLCFVLFISRLSYMLFFVYIFFVSFLLSIFIILKSFLFILRLNVPKKTLSFLAIFFHGTKFTRKSLKFPLKHEQEIANINSVEKNRIEFLLRLKLIRKVFNSDRIKDAGFRFWSVKNTSRCREIFKWV